MGHRKIFEMEGSYIMWWELGDCKVLDHFMIMEEE